jgi:GDPmannose 4,6-dehydratase
LLRRGDVVHGTVRRTSTLERSRLAHLYADPAIYNKQLFLHYAELEDSSTLRRITDRVKPQQFYHLAGQSHVGLSFEMPETTCQLTAIGTLKILEVLRDSASPQFSPRQLQEIFASGYLLRPRTPPCLITPYGCQGLATQMGEFIAINMGLRMQRHFTITSLRAERKLCYAEDLSSRAEIKLGRRSHLSLGNLDARRDWSDARGVVRGFLMILDQPTADDFILASGTTHSVRDITQTAFASLGLDWKRYVRSEEHLLRPADPVHLCGDASKAKTFGWQRSRPAQFNRRDGTGRAGGLLEP